MMKRFSCGCAAPIHESHHRVGTRSVDYPCSVCRDKPKTHTLVIMGRFRFFVKRSVRVVER